MLLQRKLITITQPDPLPNIYSLCFHEVADKFEVEAEERIYERIRVHNFSSSRLVWGHLLTVLKITARVLKETEALELLCGLARLSHLLTENLAHQIFLQLRNIQPCSFCFLTHCLHFMDDAVTKLTIPLKDLDDLAPVVLVTDLLELEEFQIVKALGNHIFCLYTFQPGHVEQVH